jgi:hypothetical protein
VEQDSLAATLSGVACVASAVVFGASVLFHIYGTVRSYAHILRNVDIAAVYLSFATGDVANAALVCNNLVGVPVQTVADSLVAATSIIVFFAIRRWAVPAKKTEVFLFASGNERALFRFQHSDLEHAGLRVAGVFALTSSWILLISPALDATNGMAGIVWLVSVALATTLLVFGVVFDNLLVPDMALYRGDRSWYKCAQCTSRSLGCMMNAHAFWHVASFFAAALVAGARDYGVAHMP